jgi:translation initiation factor 1A
MQDEEFGDFQEITEEGKEQENENSQDPLIPRRARTPKKGQFLGVVLQRLGANRMSVKCTDQKIRNCRVPGRFKRRFWIREGDAVIIEPWPDDNEKGDIVYQYSKNENYQLKKSGMLDSLKEGF